MLTRRENAIAGLGNVRVSGFGFNGLDSVYGNLQQCETEAGCVPSALCLYGRRCCEISKVVRQSAPDDYETMIDRREET